MYNIFLVQEYLSTKNSKYNTIFIKIRKNAHFETTAPTIAEKSSKIVVEASEEMRYDQKQRRIQSNSAFHNTKNNTFVFNNETISFLFIGPY